MSLTAATRRLLTLFDYLPGQEEWVRVWIDGDERGSRLVQVKDLFSIAARNRDKKITVSFASFSGGQCAHHVIRVTAIAIDIDAPKHSFASRKQIKRLQKRFPGAALVISNGVTLVYLIPEGATWRDMVPHAVAIGQEAERITGLTFDAKTLIRGDGTPGDQENHLFRFPAGYADRRRKSVEFLPPLRPTGALEEDAAGLTVSRPVAKEKATITKGESTPKSQKYCSGGSLSKQHDLCSMQLRIRRQVMAAGGKLAKAIAEAAKATGLLPAKVQALYNKYPLWPIWKPNRFKNDADVGVIGPWSWTRLGQKTRTWWANFGHSVQPLWRKNFSVSQVVRIVTTQRKFLRFVEKFKEEFAEAWHIMLKADLSDLFAKFGKKEQLDLVAARCKKKVLAVMKKGPANAQQIAKDCNYSPRQIKRALGVLQKEGKVDSTGTTKDKLWSLIYSGHTVGIVLKDIESEIETKNDAVTGAEDSKMTNQVKSAINVINSVADSTPPKIKITKEERLRLKEEARIAKEKNTRDDILRIDLPPEMEAWWLEHRFEFRLLKSRWGLAWQRYFESREEKPGKKKPARKVTVPRSLRDWAIADYKCPPSGVVAHVLSSLARRKAEAAANRASKKAKILAGQQKS